MECRINAEDPDHEFRPSPGKIESYVPPGGPNVRYDSHVYQGYVIPSTYDSMIGKLIVHGSTRGDAIAIMRRALREFQIHPIKTTVPLYREIMSDATFHRGKFDTGFIEKYMLAR